MDDQASVPMHLINLVGLTDERTNPNPTSGVQFAVVAPDGIRHTFGDQSWVAQGCPDPGDQSDGQVRVQRRTITITYGKWEDHNVED